MPFNGSGTFVRTQNWTNDATNNLPISATKFDNEDNDFASGLSLCLTRDSQGTPSSPLTWTQPLTINVAADGTPAAFGRTGGVNNPQLQLKVADATGGTINLSTAQTLGLAVAGTTALSIAAGGNVSINIPASGTALVVNGFGAVSNYTMVVAGSGTAGSRGMRINGGSTGSADFSLVVGDAAASVNNFLLSANGAFSLGPSGALASNSAGNISIAAPSSGSTVTASALSASACFLANMTAGGGSVAFEALGPASTQVNALSFAQSGQSTNYIYQPAGSGDFRVQNNSVDRLSITNSGDAFIIEAAGATAQPAGMHTIGYLDIPPNGQAANYTFVMTDRGKTVQHQSASAHTFTIPANASVAFPSGSAITILNTTGGGALTIAITTDTLVWSPSGGTGSRTLAANGIATLVKVDATHWFISGTGLT